MKGAVRRQGGEGRLVSSDRGNRVRSGLRLDGMHCIDGSEGSKRVEFSLNPVSLGSTRALCTIRVYFV